MKIINIINTSPRGSDSVSDYLINLIIDKSKNQNNDKYIVSNYNLNEYTKNNNLDELFNILFKSDSLVISSPLYIDSLPAYTLDFLVKFDDFLNTNKSIKKIKVYGLINCGFLEAEQTQYALEILGNFSYETNLNLVYGVGIGAGEFLKETKDSIPLTSNIKLEIDIVLNSFVEDLINNSKINYRNIYASPKINKFMFITLGNLFWFKLLRKNKSKLFNINKKVHLN